MRYPLHRFALPLFLAACPALSQTIIMGHHLRENVAQFLAAEPGLKERITACQSSAPKPLTADQIRALSKYDVQELASQVFTQLLDSPSTQYQISSKHLPNRHKLEELSREGMPLFLDKRMPDEIATCNALLALTTTTSSSSVAIQSLPNSHPYPVTWQFQNGLLSEIDINFHGANFDTLVRDFTRKTGVKPSEDQAAYTPNLYGATIRLQRKVYWLTPELYAVLEEDQGTVDGQIHISILSRTKYDAWLKNHSNAGPFN